METRVDRKDKNERSMTRTQTKKRQNKVTTRNWDPSPRKNMLNGTVDPCANGNNILDF